LGTNTKGGPNCAAPQEKDGDGKKEKRKSPIHFQKGRAERNNGKGGVAHLMGKKFTRGVRLAEKKKKDVPRSPATKHPFGSHGKRGTSTTKSTEYPGGGSERK